MDKIIQIFMGFLGSFGFAVLFNIRGKKLAAAAFGGLLSWSFYVILGLIVESESLRYFFVSLSLSIYAEIMARIIKTPTTTFIITSLIPLVPGGSLYYTMVDAFSGSVEKFCFSAINTLKLAVSLALGVVAVTAVVNLIHKINLLMKKN